MAGLRKVTPPGTGNVPLRTAVSHPGGEFGPNGPLTPRRVPPPGGTGNMPLRAVSSYAQGGGGASALAGGVVDPNYRPPPLAPPPSTEPRRPIAPPPPPNRTFNDPQRPGSDPRIRALWEALNGDKAADAATVARSAKLQQLIEQLMRGEGIATPDLSTDPAAQAFRIAKERDAERLREAAAAQIGASGVSGDSELATRAAQIREATGESIAANNADLTNRRRSEALTTAITGANLQMTDLQRQQAARQAANADRIALLNLLIAGDKTKQDSYEREKDRIAAERARDLVFQREQQEKRYQEAREREREREAEEKAYADKERRYNNALRGRFGAPWQTPPPRFGDLYPRRF